ncbi:hypothetical protein [Streptomyces sp. NPDC001404]|uniref:hypothetical protein n=1 Tax=Streptomyces sp. NPDC001404 TaxID=3364571 RepID=UPI0036A3127E
MQFATGQSLTVVARVDDDQPARHEVILHGSRGQCWNITGRNLEAGLGDPAQAPSHEALRARLYRALIAVRSGQEPHPCLFPLSALRYQLEVIDRVYRTAHQPQPAPAA